VIDKFPPHGQDIQTEERSLFDLVQIVTLSLPHRFLEAPTEKTSLRGLFITCLQYLDPMYRGSSIARAFWAFGDSAAAEDISSLRQAHRRGFGGCSIHKRDIAGRLERLAATHKRTAERHVQPARRALINVPGEHLRIYRGLRYAAAIQVIFPGIEEWLMTLDCFYHGGCSRSYLGIPLPRSRGPIIQQIRNSVDLVPVIFEWQSNACLFQGITHA
jgi:hypothetical protein